MNSEMPHPAEVFGTPAEFVAKWEPYVVEYGWKLNHPQFLCETDFWRCEKMLNDYKHYYSNQPDDPSVPYRDTWKRWYRAGYFIPSRRKFGTDPHMEKLFAEAE